MFLSRVKNVVYYIRNLCTVVAPYVLSDQSHVINENYCILILEQKSELHSELIKFGFSRICSYCLEGGGGNFLLKLLADNLV